MPEMSSSEISPTRWKLYTKPRMTIFHALRGPRQISGHGDAVNETYGKTTHGGRREGSPDYSTLLPNQPYPVTLPMMRDTNPTGLDSAPPGFGKVGEALNIFQQWSLRIAHQRKGLFSDQWDSRKSQNSSGLCLYGGVAVHWFYRVKELNANFSWE